MTNKEFALYDKLFNSAVIMAASDNPHIKIQPTKRQASKWRRGKGIVFKYIKVVQA